MHLLCPHCHGPIELVDLPGREVVCPSCGSSFQVQRGSTTDWRPQRTLGKFEILSDLGVGAFGTVYKARDTELDRIVAIKVPRAGNLLAQDDQERFLREARSAAQLRHPSIVPLYEVGQAEGMPYLVSAFVPGVTLADLLTARRPPPREAAEMVGAVVDALQYAHAQGVVHRDVKPSNIMVDEDGTPHLMDFGLAKREAGEVTMTVEGQILGTPAYMSPEQARGESHRVDGRSDIYSLGVILYRLLTGELPFRGNSRMLLHQVLHDEPRPPRSLNDRIPRDLETICLKAMAKEPQRRYQSARECGEDLRRFLNGQPIQARPVGQVEQLWRWCRRNPVVAGLTAAVAVTLLVGIATSTYFAIQANDAARQASAEKNIAEQNAREATARAEGERREKDLARRNLYVAHMNLARSAWEGAHVEQLRSLLDLYGQPAPGETDLRSFEWHYLRRLSQLDLRTLGPDQQQQRVYYEPNVAFSPDGRRVATASPEGGIRIWDVGTGQIITTLGDRRADFRAVAFSPDGKRIAGITCFHDSLHLWDLATGGEVRVLKAYARPQQETKSGGAGVVISSDGKRLVSLVKSDLAGEHSEVRIWDLETAKELVMLRGSGGERVDGIALSPDGRRLATGSQLSTAIQIWDAGTGQKLLTLPGYSGTGAHNIAFSPDGQRLAAPASGRVVNVWDAATGKPLVAFRGHTSWVSSVAFSPDGRRLASGGWDQTVRVWDAASGAELLTLRGHTGGVNDGVSGLAFSPDGWRLASVSGSGIVKLWNSITSPEAYELPGHTLGLTCVAFSPDGRKLASASRDRTVRVWDVTTDRVALTLRDHPAGVMGVAFSPDGRKLAAVGDAGSVKVWDALTGRELATLGGHTDRVWGVAFSPDGRRLATAGGDKTIRVWDLDSRQEIWTLEGHTMYVLSVAFSPDGQRLASASWDHTVRVWNLANGKEVSTLKGHADSVSVVAYSPDGRFIASGSDDRTVRFWDSTTGEEARVFRGHAGIVRGLAFSPDGRRLVSASGDNMIKLWDTATGQEVLTLLGGRSEAWISVAFSPDGSRIAVATSSDRKIKVWEALPVTPGARVRLEARGLVEFLFGKGLSREAVLRAVRADATVSDAVHQEALTLAEHWQPDPNVDVEQLNEVSWNIVRRTDGTPDQYKLALKQAETVCQLAETRNFLNTLGVAQYRVSQYREAIATLLRAEMMIGSIPEDLAFLAMAYHQLGQKEKAQDSLNRLREAMMKPEWATNEEARSFLREAEKLLQPEGEKTKE